MPALMVQGCSSSAGKSWLTTALCRWFARAGVRVAPFKAQNMSNNARVLPDGGEIGVAQWLQARAAGVVPDARMNPVLVKPEHVGSQVVRLGHVDHKLSAKRWERRADILWPTVRDALDELLDEFELVVVEGAGSPAETNLAHLDIANMRVAEHADASVVLTVDIDRGGAFAHLYGTWELVDDVHRHRFAAFVLNRFRGDAQLLHPGPAQLEARTGVPTIGTIPMIDHDLPDEDGATWRRGIPTSGRQRVVVVRPPTASNLDEFRRLEQVADVIWATTPTHLRRADIIVLPGSKHVTADLAWLRRTGLARAIRIAAHAHVPIIGICGGLQMLGDMISDPHGIDGSGQGLELLPVSTTFAPTKSTRPVSVRFGPDLPRPWEALSGRRAEGYEIRHGATVARNGAVEVLPDGLGWARANVLGVYPHGLFEHDELLHAMFGAHPSRTLEHTFDVLADAVDVHLDTDHVRRIARIR